MQPEVTFGKRGLARAASSPTRNSYAAPLGSQPAAYAARGANANVRPNPGAVHDSDMMLAIGGNWRKYIHIWGSLGEGTVPVSSFSVPGFLFGAVWLLYRKQYAAFFVTTLATLAISFVFPAQHRWLEIFVSATIAIYGKWWIARNTALMVARTRSLGYSEAETLRRIERQGGVSRIAVLVFFVVVIVAVAAIVAIMAAHRLPPH